MYQEKQLFISPVAQMQPREMNLRSEQKKYKSDKGNHPKGGYFASILDPLLDTELKRLRETN